MKFEDKVKILREKKYEGRETPQFLEDVVTIAKGEAYEYILGDVIFCGAKVDLSYRPMIPRKETEYWVGQALEKMKESTSSPLRILDLFAGSGCVGLAILKNNKEARVTFVEIDKKSKEQIELSLVKNNIEKERGDILIEDCVTFLENPSASQMYDVVFAVPPYVPPFMHDEVMKELHSEEPLFFFDKEDGFYFHTHILKHLKNVLKEKGTLYLEFDITQREKIEALAKEYGYHAYSFLKDPYGHECVIVISNKGL